MKRFLLALASAGLILPPAMAAEHAHPSKASDSDSRPAFELKQDMRQLWSDHVIWTRDYIVAAVADQPDAQAAAARLMKNQEEIGHAIAKFYGQAAGDKLTALLKDHIAIAVDLIKAAKASDKSVQQAADSRWQRNAEDIADFLSKANPNWPRATLVDMMKTHLSTTTSAPSMSSTSTS